jgi:hypothetical protein
VCVRDRERERERKGIVLYNNPFRISSKLHLGRAMPLRIERPSCSLGEKSNLLLHCDTFCLKKFLRALEQGAPCLEARNVVPADTRLAGIATTARG